MRFGDHFAARSTSGALTRGALAFVLITPLVVVVRIWWSGTAAAIVGALAVAIYVFAAMRYVHGHEPTASAKRGG